MKILPNSFVFLLVCLCAPLARAAGDRVSTHFTPDRSIRTRPVSRWRPRRLHAGRHRQSEQLRDRRAIRHGEMAFRTGLPRGILPRATISFTSWAWSSRSFAARRIFTTASRLACVTTSSIPGADSLPTSPAASGSDGSTATPTSMARRDRTSPSTCLERRRRFLQDQRSVEGDRGSRLPASFQRRPNRSEPEPQPARAADRPDLLVLGGARAR